MGKSSQNVKKSTVRKGEIARYEQFPLFPQCFQNTYIVYTKKRACVDKN